MKDKINKEKNLDIVELLSKRENQNLFGSSLKNKFARKKLIFKALIKGEASFREVLGDLQKALLIIFPIFRFLKKNQKRKIELIDRLILSRFCTNDLNNSVNLLNYKLNYFSDKDIDVSKKYLHFCFMVEIVKQIIISDQYCAREFIKDNAIVIDAGANIGIFSLFAHSLTPNGKIYSFEPTKNLSKILNKNIISNNLESSVFISDLALGDKKETTEIMIQDSDLGGSNIILDSDFLKGRKLDYDRKESVEMTTIDNFIKENNIERVDFIKIDTEGYERQIIKGAKNTIKNFSPVIACSAYHLKDDKTKIPELAKSINPNYKFKLVNKAEETLIFWV